MLASLEGLDHVVVLVDDLDRAANAWRSLGFTLSPRGTHSDHLGTGNYTIMFGADYVELLGVLRETPLNAPSREFLGRRGEGIERVAFTTSDAALGVAALHAKSIDAVGPIEFSRPVDLPDGARSEAAFSVFNWPTDERPGGIRIFACQHHTPDSVWIPALQGHPNTVTRIRRVEIVAANPHAAARRLAELVDTDFTQCDDGLFRIDTAPGRASIVFLSATGFGARHPSAADDCPPAEGVAALVLGVSDIEATKRVIGEHGRAAGGGLTVPGSRANGVVLVFEGD